MNLSEHDATFGLDDLEFTPEIRKVFGHPILFGLGVGVANGGLAYLRKKKITVRGALATAAVLALGETILALDEPLDKRGGRPPAWIGVLSGIGVITGLGLFTDWEQWAGGERPILLVQAPDQITAGPKTMVA